MVRDQRQKRSLTPHHGKMGRKRIAGALHAFIDAFDADEAAEAEAMLYVLFFKVEVHNLCTLP